MYLRNVFCAGVLIVSSAALAEDAPAPEEVEAVDAAPIETDAPIPDAPSNQLGLTYDEYFSEDSGRSIAEEISIDLIDLEALEAALDAELNAAPIRLSLAECIEIALAQNPDILVASVDPETAEADIYSARGEFDPIWSTDVTYLRATTSLSQQQVAFGGVSAVEQYQTTITSSISGKLHTGTLYNLAFNLNKEESTFGGFIEEFQTQLNLTVTQPLLRGAGIKYNRIRILQAQKSREIALAQVKLSVMQTVSEVVKAYWDLVGAVETVRVRQASLDNAERLLQVNETRREIGTAADIEVLQAKAGLSTRQSDMIAARAAVTNAATRVKQLLDLRGGENLSRNPLIPVDRPAPVNFDFADASWISEQTDISLQRAMNHRPEMQIAELQIETAELDAYRARKEMLPQLDIVGSYGQGGRNHKLRQSLGGIRDGNDIFYTYGIQAQIPLGNRVARGASQRAEIAERRAELSKHSQETAIESQVSIALTGVYSNQILVESTSHAVRLQEANVAAEESKLRLGTTTSWQVLQIQEDLTAAQTSELQSRINYEKALVDLRVAEGYLLEDLGIEFDPVQSDIKPDGYFRSLTPRWE